MRLSACVGVCVMGMNQKFSSSALSLSLSREPIIQQVKLLS